MEILCYLQLYYCPRVQSSSVLSFWEESPGFCQCRRGAAVWHSGFGKKIQVCNWFLCISWFLTSTLLSVPARTPVLRITVPWWLQFLNCSGVLNHERLCSLLTTYPSLQSRQDFSFFISANLITTYPFTLHLPKLCQHFSSPVISDPCPLYSYVYICSLLL